MGKVLKSAVIAAALLIQAGPSQAESDDLRDGLELFLDGLQDEMGEALRNLQDLSELAEPALRQFLLEMGPALADMMDEVRDWTRYEPPVMLPNGDIIIRRKPEPAPPMPEPSEPSEEGPIDI